MMTERAKRMIGRWAAGAIGALLMSFAFAQPPHGGGHGFGGYGAARGGGYEQAYPRGNQARIGVNGYASRWGLRPNPSSGHYAPQSPYRAISADARPMPHPPDGSLPMRAGSIRADVARYNEERGGRPMPPPRSQEDVPRPPFFSSFYRN
ncbi:peptide-binding protein [Burkholderia alba]|uniref:peptide-binding protein n=1 Tax=Burkholderia alba TaxID=2683677 RepID=UPI002B05CCCC|nr:peptide-binding protein [Burkholderia alba]